MVWKSIKINEERWSGGTSFGASGKCVVWLGWFESLLSERGCQFYGCHSFSLKQSGFFCRFPYFNSTN
jgi:hypothetical protein